MGKQSTKNAAKGNFWRKIEMPPLYWLALNIVIFSALAYAAEYDAPARIRAALGDFWGWCVIVAVSAFIVAVLLKAWPKGK